MSADRGADVPFVQRIFHPTDFSPESEEAFDHALAICLFRKEHAEALSGLFRQVVRLCDRAGLVKLGHVALDGSKVRANASKHKGGNYTRMKKEEKRLSEEVEKWFRRAEEADKAEDEEFGEDRRGDELPEWVKNKQKRLEKLREAKALLEEEAKQEAEEKAKTPAKYRGGRKPRCDVNASSLNPPGYNSHNSIQVWRAQ